VEEESTVMPYCSATGAELKKTKDKGWASCSLPPQGYTGGHKATTAAGSTTTNTTATPLKITWVNKVSINHKAFLLVTKQYKHTELLFFAQKTRDFIPISQGYNQLAIVVLQRLEIGVPNRRYSLKFYPIS
jgi:hypothetical protein